MKLYSNSTLSLKVSGCKECPHRIGKRFKCGSKFYTEQVCNAATRTAYDFLSQTEKKEYSYPSVAEQVKHGGYLDQCPLPEYED